MTRHNSSPDLAAGHMQARKVLANDASNTDITIAVDEHVHSISMSVIPILCYSPQLSYKNL
jgi:hypothetical protein